MLPRLWFVSDWHLGCTIDQYRKYRRPFDNPNDQFKVFRKEHNQRVLPTDTVIVAGDVVDKNSEHPQKELNKVNLLNGNKILIRGNHDVGFSDSELKQYFQKIIPDGQGMEINFQAEDTFLSLPPNLPSFWITHYPSRASLDHFNLVGHVHGAWTVQKNMINIGVDANHFRPWSVAEILFQYNAVCNVYDRDVWAYQNQANTKYENRGRTNSYTDNIK